MKHGNIKAVIKNAVIKQINKMYVDRGVEEEWIYSSKYLYFRDDVLVEFAERAGVDQQADALTAPEAIMEVAFGADFHVRRPFVFEDVGLAGRADLPDIGRRLFLGRRAVGEPSHGVVLSPAPAFCGRCAN